MTQTKFINSFRIGTAQGESIGELLAAPKWDCGWYWGFGYLQNRDIHHHIDGLGKEKNQNMFDALKAYYGESLTIKDDADLWTFCELMITFYALKQAAEVLGRGGSHFTTNPVADVIKSESETKRINETVLPAIFDALEDVLKKYR